jgi:hypothetical protein
VFELVSVRVGEWDLRTDLDCTDATDNRLEFCTFPAIDVPVNRTIKHSNYNQHSKKFFNDIALVKLSRPIPFNRFVKPICLPLDQKLWNRDYTNKTFDVAGDEIEEVENGLILMTLI